MGGRLSSGISYVPNTNGFRCLARGDDGFPWSVSFDTRFSGTDGGRLDTWKKALNSPVIKATGTSTADPSSLENNDPKCMQTGGFLSCFAKDSENYT
jgi:hypothetical protein